MPDPICSMHIATTHYDQEAAQCTAEPLESTAGPSAPSTSSTHSPPAAVSSPPDHEPTPQAVDQLVRNHNRRSSEEDGGCLRKGFIAAGTCASAVGAAIITPVTIGSGVVALGAGVACGAALADAEAACR